MAQSHAGDDPDVSDLVAAGRVRTGLFLPQYANDPETGELRGLGTGHMAIELTRAIAARLGIEARIEGYPTPHSVVERLNSGDCDLAFLGIEPKRAAIVDFSPPVFQFDYTFLTPAGSAIRTLADADRSGVRIAIMRGHASALALELLAKHAELVGAELPDAAFELLRAGHVDALAAPRDVLLDLSCELAGSRVLDDAYGANRVGVAMRKGQPGRLSYLSRFVEEAKSSGLVGRAIEAGALRGFSVAG